ncbi:MAG: PD40 domain-containing protein [Bacteroidales bacterium]|nr:PD40 domain-containing protein [Bacteroidales bacterium]
MKKQAAEYFASDQFSLAFPLYSQLLSLDPENPELNYHFGVCLLYSNGANTEEAIPYLEKAINKIPEMDLYYHLAVAYHLNYFFTDAIYNYRKYLQLSKNKARKEYDVSRKIAMCQNGIDLLRAVDDLYVIEKSEVDKKAFYRSYNLMDYGGRILNLPNEFLNKADLKSKDDHIAYFNPNAKLLFYAVDNKDQKDIYYRIQQKDKEWSPAIALSSTINTEYDEDYPIFMPDGKTLYFSSKGHNTMGGYDIFQSVFDSITGQWSKPVNLSFPFNTPADDILFITNADETVAWFASDRSSDENKISVYKVGIIKKENQVADLANVYSKEIITDNDLGRIKNMASLDINISAKDFQEIPVQKAKKLEVLTKNDANRISQNIRQSNLINVDRQIGVRKSQEQLTDSIKNVILSIDANLETLKSQFLQTQYLTSLKAGNAQQEYTKLKSQLEKVQKESAVNRKKELLKEANKYLFRALRYDFETNKFSAVEKSIDKQIEARRELLTQASALFGDIQKNTVTQNDKEAQKNILQLNNLIHKADTLSDYTKIIDYTKGEFYKLSYPANLSNERSFIAYRLEDENRNSPIAAVNIRYAGFIPELKTEIATSIPTRNDPAPRKTEQRIPPSLNPGATTTFPTSTGNSTSASEHIRQELSVLNKLQTERLDWLKQQSAILTKKASEKLDASNVALLEFEKTRDQYNKGLINDKNSVIAKQEESQDLLYQSLAIIGLAEKTDSIYKAELKRSEQSTDQIFRIEQALKNNAIENAKNLLVSFEKSLDNPIFNQENLVLDWINSSVKAISLKKQKADIAFEQSQTLTDESMQLMTEAEDLKEKSKAKSNAFKRRQITIEAEKKENEAKQKQAEAAQYLASGNKLYEEIKKAESIQKISHEFSDPIYLAQNTNLIINPEKRLSELNARLEVREQSPTTVVKTKENRITQDDGPKLNLSSLPKMDNLIAYKTKQVIGQLLAEELDVNKRETVYLLELGKTLNREESRANLQKIEQLRKEADALQNASIAAFNEAGKIYNQLSPEDKETADKENNDFENYLKNIRKRIAELLDEVTELGNKAAETKEAKDRESLKKQAEEKEQIAMYLILEEFDIIARRNKQTLRKNALIIDKLALENKDKQEQKLMKAVFDQIQHFVQLAENQREKAKGEALSFALQRVLLQDAFSYESSALDLQLEAIRMMREKDTESMLAYQPQNTQVPTPKVQTSTISTPDITTTALTQTTQNKNLASLENTSKKETNPAPKKTNDRTETRIEKPQVNTTQVKEDKPTVIAINEQVEPKQKTDPVTTNPIRNSATPKSLSNSTASGTIFPNVSLSQNPSGTQFSVQIAAISGLKTTSTFLNVIELFAIKDSQKDLYRYFSGKFTSLKAAVIRRNALRKQGYADAFIKSWKDGNPVSLIEAAGKIDDATLALMNETSLSIPSQYRHINFAATNISQLTGVYYSVQVGVYSKPRSSANLFGIKPLYHDRMKNGYWVYFNGIFKSIADAEKNKTRVRSKGIPDAFVVAFNQGEKVSLVNARKALNAGNSFPASNDIIILEDAANKVDAELNTIGAQKASAPVNRIYKIQIGVFSHAVSFDWVKTRLGNSQVKIDYFVNNYGKYIYSIGNFKTYSEASTFNTNQVKLLVKDAFVVTYEDGKKANLTK